jgi:hypothetical protein
LDQIGDGLLPARGRVQLAAHLGETQIDAGAEVAEVLTQGIETRRRGFSEVADLGSDLGDVPIGCALAHKLKDYRRDQRRSASQLGACGHRAFTVTNVDAVNLLATVDTGSNPDGVPCVGG